MGSPEADIVSKAEALLASAKKYNGDYAQRHALMQQIDLLYQQLEDPMEAMIKQWHFVRIHTASLGMYISGKHLSDTY